MDLKDVNELCYRIMFFYDYVIRCDNSSSTEMIENMAKEYQENLKKAKFEVNEDIIKETKKNLNKYRDIYNYCIVFREELLSIDLLTEIVRNNHLSRNNYFNILNMSMELNDEIVQSVLRKVNLDSIYLGTKPYDYRYNVLKRTEISDDIKNKILSSYDKHELESIEQILEDDLNDEIVIKKIKNNEDLKRYSDVFKLYIAYTTIKDYLNRKVYKK